LGRFRPLLERIENRLLLTTFTVSNLNDSGGGSLRQALMDANNAGTADLINFTVSGTIQLTSGDLPSITDEVDIDGTTSPGFAGTPVVEIDYNGFGGLRFDAGSAGSDLRSLGAVNAVGAGVSLNDHNILVVGNFIGVRLDGATVAGNGGDGLVINATSFDNVIGVTTTLVPNVGSNAISVASNVISGNHVNGIAIHGSSGNQIVANYIGTNVDGTVDRGNGENGIRLDGAARDNRIGGTIVFNDPNGLVPDSNLISGNRGNGVLITDGAHANFLASNFIGTTVTGTAALGNDLDGVAIVDGAHDNVLAGTFVNLKPFVFANVISGNRHNGIRVKDADSNVIHANYLGLGVDNMTPVGNVLDGMLVEGASANTQFGGIIPLGNVAAANGQNGLEIRDTARGTVVFNTFAGLAAFEDFTTLGNGANGMLITSTGGDNIIRTNVISENHFNGIEISGEARGVQLTDFIVGLNTSGMTPMPNGGNGVLIGGDAHDNVIGGFQPSVVINNTISANLGHGVAFTGTAHDNRVINTFIGTNIKGQVALGNAGAGVFLGSGTSSNTIGGAEPGFRNLISGNFGNGVELSGTTDNTVAGNLIGTDSFGFRPLPNGGNGVFIDNSSANLIGGPIVDAGNVIAFNGGAGVYVNSGTNDAILSNSIYNNLSSGIVLLPGANDNQEAPQLTHIRRGHRFTLIGGVLFSAPNSIYHLEFFANTSTNPSLAEQGETLVGSADVTTNSRGVAHIRSFVPTQPSTARFTATATSTGHNTSQFSNAVPRHRLRHAFLRRS
jgi:trimeric autotransporter adhesin